MRSISFALSGGGRTLLHSDRLEIKTPEKKTNSYEEENSTLVPETVLSICMFACLFVSALMAHLFDL